MTLGERNLFKFYYINLEIKNQITLCWYSNFCCEILLNCEIQKSRN